jgi:dihydroorotase
MTPYLLKNCRLPDGEIKDILIEDEKIKDISATLNNKGTSIDCSGKWLIPGIIDVHTHIRDMELAEKEDWLSASQAAASGGITTMFDMPNTKPATFNIESLLQKRNAARKSIVNFGYNFGVTEFNHDEIRRAKPIASLKMFMAESSSGYVVEQENIIAQVFKVAEEIDKPVIIHSELQSCVEKHTQLYKPTLQNHNKIRNRECAINATRLVLKLAQKTAAKIYLAHISTAQEIELIRLAKKDGMNNIFCETTPHYIFINEEILSTTGNYGKVNPPLHDAQDNRAIIDGIIDGTVDTIGTDHAPHTLSEKNREYSKAPSGFPGLETSFALMFRLVETGRISLKRLTELMSENPAKIFKIKNRGKIEKGMMADLTLIDPNFIWKVDPQKFYSKAKYSPYAGMELKGKVVTTIVNGNIVWQNNKLSHIKGKEVEFS